MLDVEAILSESKDFIATAMRLRCHYAESAESQVLLFQKKALTQKRSTDAIYWGDIYDVLLTQITDPPECTLACLYGKSCPYNEQPVH